MPDTVARRLSRCSKFRDSIHARLLSAATFHFDDVGLNQSATSLIAACSVWLMAHSGQWPVAWSVDQDHAPLRPDCCGYWNNALQPFRDSASETSSLYPLAYRARSTAPKIHGKIPAVRTSNSMRFIKQMALQHCPNIVTVFSSFLRMRALDVPLCRKSHKRSRRVGMGIVMIRCPKTSRTISTGIEVDRAKFNSSIVFFSHVWCPICHIKHEWFARDAWICESAFVCDVNFDQCDCERQVA